MAVNNLLVAIDESEGARKALDLAADIVAMNPNGHLDVAYVVSVPVTTSQTTNLNVLYDSLRENGRKFLDSAIESLGDAKECVTPQLLMGVSPAAEIVKLIDESSYDMVVIGSRGLNGLQEYMGSVSRKVLHGSKVPVLIAK